MEFFVQNVVIQNDPLVKGSLFVDITYDDVNTEPTTSSNYRIRRQGRMRIDYYDSDNLQTRKVILSELYDFGRKFRWTFCPTSQKCEAVTYKSPMPLFYYTLATRGEDGLPSQPTSTQTFLQSTVTCNAYKRNFATGNDLTKAEATSLNAVDTIWIETATNRPCAAKLRSGKEFIFYFNTKPTFNTSPIGDASLVDDRGSSVIPIKPSFLAGTFNCPEPTCKVPLDLYFVLDESGSIDSTEFSKLKSFVVDLINFFTISPDDVQVGAVMFAWGTRQVMSLQNDKATAVSLIQAVRSQGGNTCAQCGISNAHDRLGRCATCSSANDPVSFPADSRVRTQVAHAIIIITDGNSNVNVGLEAETTANVRKDNITVYAIGVGNGVDVANLNKWATTTNDVFQAVNFDDLKNLLSQLLTATCEEITVSTCGRQCTGLCICDQQCICPSTCDSTDKCTTGSCDPQLPQLGCIPKSILIDCQNAVANDPCTTATCDPNIGCVNSPVVCPKSNCSYNFCDPQNGCRSISNTDPILATPDFQNLVPKPNSCFDNDVCTVDGCDALTNNCTFTPVPCDKCVTKDGSTRVDCRLPRFNPKAAEFNACNPFVCDPNSPNERYDSDNGETVGPGTCVAQPKNFEDDNPCIINECVVVNGAAALNRSSVDCVALLGGVDKCNVAMCNPLLTNVTQNTVGLCSTTPISCDDGNACTIDTCDPDAGCLQPTARPTIDCLPDNQCKIASCNPNIGCEQADFQCVQIPEVSPECYEVDCKHDIDPADDIYHPYITDPSTGKASRRVDSTYPCAYTPINPDVNFDACNVCPPQNAACWLDQNSAAPAIAIGAGIVAAIVVAIIVGIACAVGGGYGGYKYHQMRKADPMANAVSNELYQAPPTSGTSAIYS